MEKSDILPNANKLTEGKKLASEDMITIFLRPVAQAPGLKKDKITLDKKKTVILTIILYICSN